MHYPGYLRYFDSAIRLLAARGHHIDLVFDNPDKQSEGTEAISDMAGSVEVLGRMPTRGDIWAIVARDVRGTMDYGRYSAPGLRGDAVPARSDADGAARDLQFPRGS